MFLALLVDSDLLSHGMGKAVVATPFDQTGIMLVVYISILCGLMPLLQRGCYLPKSLFFRGIHAGEETQNPVLMSFSRLKLWIKNNVCSFRLDWSKACLLFENLKNGRYYEALTKWEAALTLMPERAILHEQKAQVLLEIGEAWKALKAATSTLYFFKIEV